jgi:hypothetical protein
LSNGNIYAKSILYGGFSMSRYNVKSKTGIFLISAIMSLLACAYTICMDSPVYSAIQIVREKLRAGQPRWHRVQAENKAHAEAALRTHLEGLDYITDSTDLLGSINTVLRRKHEGKPVSPETSERVRAYGAADRKFRMLEDIEQSFALSLRSFASNATSPHQIYDKMHAAATTVCNSCGDLSDGERAALRNIIEITGREQRPGREN